MEWRHLLTYSRRVGRMRIGVDMLGAQDPGGRGRGIGRYVDQFVRSLIGSDPVNDYVLYSFDRLPPPSYLDGDRTAVRVLPSGRAPLAEVVQALVDRNPDRLDLYVVTSPFSRHEGYMLPTRPADGLRLASILYDLIPMLLDRDFYLGSDPAQLRAYFECVARLRGYDLILAISEASRQDAVAHLGMPARRVVNVSAATREGFFAPTPSCDLPDGLRALGVVKPFVFTVASADPHKNSDGLIRAFALLPHAVRSAHQLVIAGALAGNYVLKWNLTTLAERHGIAGQLLLTGRLHDEQLREAYQHCAAFAFVSHYEGFGLPILEAMLCGAPVVAGDNSSQVEVAAGAGLLARTTDDADVADKVGRVLTDADLAARLRQLGPERARGFRWQETVRRARAAIRALPQPRGPRLLLACFVPPPNRHAAAADHTTALLRGLRRHYTMHLYHDAGQVPEAALANADVAAFDGRLFERHDRVWNYHAVLHLSDGRISARDPHAAEHLRTALHALRDRIAAADSCPTTTASWAAATTSNRCGP